ncbi:PTS sugar transporter subunit IIA [Streptomyces sp. NPDC048659]|uniref:BglG family transcription antiterminator n=1 Tax=Streptomyces sp. NPDC048659 TaxID=3155489 RepID=UPI003424AFE9
MSTRSRQNALVEYLRQARGPVPPAEAADALGVTRRSVRGYVARLNESARPLRLITSTPAGYRIDPAVYETARAWRENGAASGAARSGGATPDGRLFRLVRRLTTSPQGVDVHTLAGQFFISDSTLEADLTKVRRRIEPYGLRLTRSGPTVRLTGPERDRRRLISALFRDEAAAGFLSFDAVRQEFSGIDLGPFKAHLVTACTRQGYLVNELALNDVLLHVAITLEGDDLTARDGSGTPGTTSAPDIPDAPDTPGATTRRPRQEQIASLSPMADIVDRLARRHFGVTLPALELEHLALQLDARALVRDDQEGSTLRAEERGLVRRIVTALEREYALDLADEEFLRRLTLHVQHLRDRARSGLYNRNPLTAAVKTSYPLIYELAVYLCREIQQEWSVNFSEDEIAFIAMHVGAHLHARTRPPGRVGCTLVCPAHYEMAPRLKTILEAEFRRRLVVERLVTRLGERDLGAGDELVISTVPLPEAPAHTVVIRPFPTTGDLDAVRSGIDRAVRRRDRRAARERLLGFLEPALFFRDLEASGRAAAIRVLHEGLARLGIVGPRHVREVLERERLSSTAFADGFAIPHAMTMTARRSAIALAINEHPVEWGDKRVNVIALIAFSDRDRAAFRTAFEELTEVLGDRSAVRRLVTEARDYAGLRSALTVLLDEGTG